MKLFMVKSHHQYVQNLKFQFYITVKIDKNN